MAYTTIGDLSIQTVVEEDGVFGTPEENFPDATPELVARHVDWLAPRAYDPVTNLLLMPVQAYVVKTAEHTVVIDTCIGNHKRQTESGYAQWHLRTDFKLLDDMMALGVPPDEVDYVMCTHLHVDHCGWNTRLINGRWVPTFPNAKYIFGKVEYEAWEAAANESERNDARSAVWEDSCLPIFEAGQAHLVDADFELENGIWLSPAFGHSPGQVCVNFRSENSHAIFTGDMMHHALQCVEPDWSTCFCPEPEEAARSRRRILGDVADSDTIVIPAHFPGQTAGYVGSDGDHWRWSYMEFDNGVPTREGTGSDMPV